MEKQAVRFEGIRTPLTASHLKNVVFDVADFDAGVFPARSVRQKSFKPEGAGTQRAFILKSNILSEKRKEKKNPKIFCGVTMND